MKIRLIAVGKRMPKWVVAAYDDYARRLPHECRLELVEIAPGTRSGQSDAARAIAEEDARMVKALAPDMDVMALTVDGKSWSTDSLADDLRRWLGDGRDRALLIGGPDGLGPQSLAAAGRCVSLSALTLPHPLVRVILAEQLFRAHSILIGHPYHRA
ncbi:MAG: 23S rRNA (pseudouridine(1915)-N(3))-methyltransferase RlmH [Salinisphaera sp.]|jgi:23S rRNA (pseudouridine1915-N3)-methyltransferase|nr:23S rRNA (pseudouridine(1915)-N(3))-methyltransferase RlmH [Salinisphaera sp.]